MPDRVSFCTFSFCLCSGPGEFCGGPWEVCGGPFRNHNIHFSNLTFGVVIRNIYMTRAEFELTARQLRAHMLKIALDFFGSKDDAEDVAQEAMLQLGATANILTAVETCQDWRYAWPRTAVSTTIGNSGWTNGSTMWTVGWQ